MAREIGPNVRGIALDIAEPEKISGMLADVGPIDRLLIVAIERDSNSVRNYDIARARRAVTVKLVGYTEVVHTMLDRMNKDASVVIFGGLAGERPYPGSTTVTMVNGAVGAKWMNGKVAGLVKVTNLFNQDIQQHVFGDILKRTVSFEVRIKS
jgi:NADP-dependent 3-hydroxy acid dehydrogenase YdfG